MGKLTIIYDQDSALNTGLHHLPRKMQERLKVATLDVADDLEDADIYKIARKLAELLLEQI